MNRPQALRLLASVNAASFSALQLALMTLFPFFADRLGVSVAAVIACFSAGSLCFLWGSPFWASLSDRVGRQRILRLGLSGLFFSLAILAALVFSKGALVGMTALGLLLVSRLVYGLTASAIVPSAQALQADLSGGDAMKAMLTHTLSLNAGRVIGPLAVLLSGSRPELLVAGLVGWSFVLLIVNRIAPQTTAPRRSAAAPPKLAAVFRAILPVFVVALLFTMFLEALNASLAVTLKSVLDLDSATAGLMMAKILLVAAGVMLATQTAARRWLKPTWKQGLVLGGGILVVGAALFALADSGPGLWAALILLAAGFGLVPPSYLAALSDHGPRDGHHGGRAGWIASAHTLGYAGGGALIALALRLEFPAPVVLVVLSLLVAVSVGLLLKHARSTNLNPEVRPC